MRLLVSVFIKGCQFPLAGAVWDLVCRLYSVAVVLVDCAFVFSIWYHVMVPSNRPKQKTDSDVGTFELFKLSEQPAILF